MNPIDQPCIIVLHAYEAIGDTGGLVGGTAYSRMKLWAWVWQHDIDWIAERLERVVPTEVCTGKTRARRRERLHFVTKV